MRKLIPNTSYNLKACIALLCINELPRILLTYFQYFFSFLIFFFFLVDALKNSMHRIRDTFVFAQDFSDTIAPLMMMIATQFIQSTH